MHRKLGLAFLFCLILATAASVFGQRQTQTRDLSRAERNVRAIEIGASATKNAGTILAEVNEDFARLKVINDEVKETLSANTPLDYKAVSVTAAEIKKRGARLRINLAGLPKLSKENKPEQPAIPLDEAEMKSSLSALHDLMTSLLGNPVFSDLGSTDNELAFKARRDLEALIEMSDVTKQGAEKLAKRARK